jgi:polyhydroxyalkanoate synthesis regulator phasin
MNVTVVGKTLVFITLALSLLLFGFALGIYSNRIDWPGQAPTLSGDKTKGRVTELREQVDQWSAAALLAHTRWQQNRDALVRLEARRPEDLQWYAQQIKLLEDGSPNDVIQQIVLRDAKDGKLEVDSAGHPLMEPAPGVRFSRRGYREEFNHLKDESEAATTAANDLVNQQKALTQVINGDEGKPRGLRTLIQEEELAQRNAGEEVEHLKPRRINLQVEGQMLQQRQRALAARLDELKKSGVALLGPASALDSPSAPRHTPRP